MTTAIGNGVVVCVIVGVLVGVLVDVLVRVADGCTDSVSAMVGVKTTFVDVADTG
jgi:hypothetical protein